MDRIKKIINLNSTILITGETGVGKSKCARMIYDQSNILKERFLAINVASLKDDLIESELFGYKKGAFTGAYETKAGFLKKAGRGTIFLDEIGELSLSSQKKLLTLLEDRSYYPVGSTTEEYFEGRLLLATNKDLAELVKKGLFREDLYYRISIFEIKLPPLRDHVSLIEEFIASNLEEFKKKYNKQEVILSEELLSFLKTYSWPGNIRELKNCMHYLVALGDEKNRELSDLPPWISSSVQKKEVVEQGELYSTLEKIEKNILLRRLEKNRGKIIKTAKSLGISKATLIAKNKKYGIDSSKIRAIETLSAA